MENYIMEKSAISEADEFARAIKAKTEEDQKLTRVAMAAMRFTSVVEEFMKNEAEDK